MTKVCVSAICKNEEKFVDRWMDSVGSADDVVVLDTGSTDGTCEKLVARGARVFQMEFNPWRFDAPRNACIDLCPRDHVIFSIDLDEVVAEPDWVDRIKAAWGSSDRGRYRYVWSHRPDGTDGNFHTYDKLHTHDHEWYLPCHEILRRRPGLPQRDDVWVDVPITVRHYPDGSKSRGGYLQLLQLGTRENPDNDRMAHYCGREMHFQAMHDGALVYFERHLAMQNVWADERCASLFYGAESLAALGRPDDAERWFLRACGEATHLREPFVRAAKFYNSVNNFPMAYAMAKRALRIEERTSSYVNSDSAWNEGPWDALAVAAYYIGLKPESVASARRAYKLCPWDDRVKENLATIERMSPEVAAPNSNVPTIVERQPWSADPKFGLVVSTYGLVPYVHLALAVREKFYPDVPCLVHDDCSPKAAALRKLAADHGASFASPESNMNHTRGDMTAMISGMRWAREAGLDVLVKMSRRFVPKVDWRPSLKKLAAETQHATYAGVFDPTWNLRTECIAFHVERWLPHLPALSEMVRGSDWLWVEKVVHDMAIKVLPWGTGQYNGFAVWDFVGLGKWCENDTSLWHDTTSPATYAKFARELGLNYREQDFALPN